MNWPLGHMEAELEARVRELRAHGQRHGSNPSRLGMALGRLLVAAKGRSPAAERAPAPPADGRAGVSLGERRHRHGA